MPDVNSYIEKLKITNPMRENVVRDAIKSLHLSPGSQGLDAGCGIGYQTLMLAEEVGGGGHVTGLDFQEEFIAIAQEKVVKSESTGNISFRQGDIYDLPFEDNTFNWLWSSDCAGYPARNPEKLMKELSRVVKPGGTIALLIYSSQQLLPGHPLLEARLNATATGIAPFTMDMKPGEHHLRVLGWFRAAGLKESGVQTFVADFYAPLNEEKKRALYELIRMRWEKADKELPKEDMEEYKRLINPDSPDFILNRADFYAFFTYSLFTGKVEYKE